MSHNNYRGPGPIPNRWLYCPRKSEHVIAEKFLAFKTPLSSAYTDQMPLECIFLPEMLFDYCKTIKLKLSLWIDLTNTKRFYDRSVIEMQGAKYVKLQCRGHGETPSREQTQSFIEIVDSFFELHPVDVVGVHCTHGFNRTGFLIVSYLVERLDFSVEAALAVFAKARPPGIYKQDYINELFRRYEDEDVAIPAPELPNWCLEYDDSNDQRGHSMKRKLEDRPHTSDSHNMLTTNGADGTMAHEINGDDNAEERSFEANTRNEAGPANEKSRKKRKRELRIENATFMKGVPGVHAVQDPKRLRELQEKVQRMCGWDEGGFPGAQPVSMDRKNIKLLNEMAYQVSWKADGTRYMMLIEKQDEIYFVDRNNSCFQVKGLTFVKSSNLCEHLEETLLDGEMVLDKYQGQIIPRYLIYDIIQVQDINIGKEPFDPNRTQCIQTEIIEPRHRALKQGIIRREKEPFGVRRKEFWEIHQAARLLGEKFAKILSHEPDGLIFQPTNDPYIAGVCPNVLKWKPLEMNSVDFRLKIQEESGEGILKRSIACLYVGGCDRPLGQIKYTKFLRELNNKIIECTINAQGNWEFMRERTDKTLPNSYSTAIAVIESICHPITKEKLLDYIAKHGFKKDDNMMPPPRSSSQHPHHQQLRLNDHQEVLKPPQ